MALVHRAMKRRTASASLAWFSISSQFLKLLCVARIHSTLGFRIPRSSSMARLENCSSFSCLQVVVNDGTPIGVCTPAELGGDA